MTTSPPSQSDQPLSVLEAILMGQLVVTVPALLLLFGVPLIGLLLPGRTWVILLIVGFIAAWLWWSISIPRWRRWALRRGCDAEKLHKYAVLTLLEYPKGFILEKTEIPPKESPK